MKKNTLLIMFSFLFSLNFIVAQTLEERQKITANYDLEKLDQMARDAAEKFTANKKRALELAAIYGWKLIIKLPNGGRSELIGVSKNGDPIYVGTDNREGAITTKANKVHSGGVAGLDLNGENMIIGIWDRGRVRETHELLISPVYQIDGSFTIGDHATHVAGTMVGSGAVQGGAAKGMAPEATLWAYDWFNDVSEVIVAAANGLLISNHSYSYFTPDNPLWSLGYYSADFSAVFDDITYNAPYFLPIFSAGNQRNDGNNIGDFGYDSLRQLGVTKNSVVVAAVNEVLDYTGPNSVVMSSFSNWGPTDDGRIKPDISTKGVAMFSSVGDADDSYDTYTGTSMAAPTVTGSLILMQQHYNNLNENFMLSATLRGLAIHTAEEAGTHPGPDYRFGWGLLNVERAAEVITNNGTSSLIVEEELQNGDVYTIAVKSNDIDNLGVSITWTDVPGVPLPPGPEAEDNPTPMLINDLDLRVSKDGGATYFPWKLDPANFHTPATTGDNLVDNVEKVDVVGATGDYLIQVSHKGSVLTNDLQAFSLIVTGIEEVLSTDEFVLENAIKVYPNPSKGLFTLQNTNNIDLTNATIYDINGRHINTLNLEDMPDSITIDLSSVASGMYFMSITSKDSKHIVKLFKH